MRATRDALDQPIELAAGVGDLDELDRIARTGTGRPSTQLIETAAELGGHDELRRLAAAGNRDAGDVLEDWTAD